MPPSQFDELAALLREIDDLEAVARILDWDQQTHMPRGGAAARGRQMALVGRLAHERRSSEAMRRLIDQTRALEEYQPSESESPQDVADATYRAAMVRLARREHERAVAEPAELVESTATHMASSYVAWTVAKEAGDFTSMVPYLERTMELSRRLAACHPSYDEPADVFIDRADPTMTSAEVRKLFATLKPYLVPMVRELATQTSVDDSCLEGDFDIERQIAFASELVRRLGYDFDRGRRDETFHPFMTRFSGGDVRITTSFRRGGIARGLFGAIHEAGHALYEQNIDPRFDGGPLGHGVSAGVHESQSRLWENLVGRSAPFWDYYYPELARVFPETYAVVSRETFYRAINQVRPSAIRVEADEVTYNLHVMLRFELEQALWRGDLAIKDLGEAFRARLSSDLGVEIDSDGHGVLQDVHWYVEPIGGSFQGYTLGNLMSAQFFAAARRALPDLEHGFREGDFSQLLGWLRQTVYRQGALEEPNQLLIRATGADLGVEPYVAYLRTKYGELGAVKWPDDGGRRDGLSGDDERIRV